MNALCLDGRMEGAIKFGNTQTIANGAIRPKDERRKSGKYIEKRRRIISHGKDCICINGTAKN